MFLKTHSALLGLLTLLQWFSTSLVTTQLFIIIVIYDYNRVIIRALILFDARGYIFNDTGEDFVNYLYIKIYLSSHILTNYV